MADLTASDVDYAVVGGVAVIANGYVRLTEDLDLLVSDAHENLVRLLNVLGRFGEGFARELKPEDFVRQEGSIRIMEEFDLDIFTLMQGRVLDDFRPALRRCELGTFSFRHLAPEHLVMLKQGSWREKDKLDVAAMTEIIERERKSK